MFRVLNEDLGKKPFKMMECHELTEHHERMRAEKSRHTLNEIAQGTLPNLVLTYEKKFCIQEIVNHENDLIWSFSSSIETRSLKLNPLDFSVWSILEARILATLHTSLESLKAKLQMEWKVIPQEQIRVALYIDLKL
ncbi:hypothetical protein FHG87_024790 [Trinorchestia longiramus]|nr:hypothetical protein FHG87_024790 [Trinorchestia longiramus]